MQNQEAEDGQQAVDGDDTAVRRGPESAAVGRDLREGTDPAVPQIHRLVAGQTESAFGAAARAELRHVQGLALHAG